MGLEIERKFLVKSDSWRSSVTSEQLIQQGYLAREDGNTVRIRRAGDQAWVTFKGPAHGVTRAEFEWSVSLSDAEEILNQLSVDRKLEKTRYLVSVGQRTWELDVFHGANAGLQVAEIELESEDAPLDLPEWVGKEVSQDYRYANANLVSRPWSQWAAIVNDGDDKADD